MFRLVRVLRVLCFSLLLVAGVRAQSAVLDQNVQPTATFSLLTERDPSLHLHGPFRFHTGDNPAWANPSFDDATWPLLPGDRSWVQSGYAGFSGVAWYRFTLVLPAGDGTYALQLPRILRGYQLFVDGRLTCSQGDPPPHERNDFAQPALVSLPRAATSGLTTVHVALRVWIDPESARYVDGGLTSAIEVGALDLLKSDFESRRLAQQATSFSGYGLGLLELVAAATSCTLFFFSRSEEEYLWFALVCAGLAGQNFSNAWQIDHSSPISLTETAGLVWLRCFQVAFLLFLRKLLHGRWTLALRLTLVCIAISLCDDLLWGIPHLVSTTASNLIDNIFDLPVFFWSFALVVNRAWHRRPDARVLILPVMLLILTQQLAAMAITLAVSGHPSLLAWTEAHLTVGIPFRADYLVLGEGIFLLAMLGILIYRFARTRREQDRVSADLQAAREIQQTLVPQQLPITPGLRISAAYYPAQEVGGDFFQVAALPTGDTLLIIGDVAGKGLPAALTVSLAIGSLRTLADATDSPAVILHGLNRRLCGRGSGFTTCLALRLGSTTSGGCTLTLANAGHLPPYLNGDELPIDTTLPLGLDESAVFRELTHHLLPGDHLAVLTDGIPEATQAGKLFGFARTAEASRQTAEQIAEVARGYGQADDITALTIDVLELSSISGASMAAARA